MLVQVNALRRCLFIIPSQFRCCNRDLRHPVREVSLKCMCQLLDIRLLGQSDFSLDAITKHSYTKELVKFSLISHFVLGYEIGSELLNTINIPRAKYNSHIINIKEDNEPVIAKIHGSSINFIRPNDRRIFSRFSY